MARISKHLTQQVLKRLAEQGIDPAEPTPKKAKKRSRNKGQKEVPFVFELNDLPRPVAEFRFHDQRRWRFDYAWPEFKVALEVEGGVWTGGHHTRGSGFIDDMEKYNAAAALGWLVFRCTPKQLKAGDVVLRDIQRAMDLRG